MRGLGQNITRGGGVEAGGECQEYRDEIRQFGAIEIESGCDILFYQVNHRLAEFAAIAMDVLEQVQRKGAGTVEKLAVLRLKVQKFAAFDPGKHRLQPFDRGGGQHAFVAKRIAMLARKSMTFRGGVSKKRGQGRRRKVGRG